jgi:glycine cleavage system protein P-like pyridoxal-binding family
MSAFLDSRALPAFSMKGTPNSQKKRLKRIYQNYLIDKMHRKYNIDYKNCMHATQAHTQIIQKGGTHISLKYTMQICDLGKRMLKLLTYPPIFRCALAE